MGTVDIDQIRWYNNILERSIESIIEECSYQLVVEDATVRMLVGLRCDLEKAYIKKVVAILFGCELPYGADW